MSRLSRELTPDERDVLEYLLAFDFPGAPELRAQAKVARVTGKCACGPTIDLVVNRANAPPASIEARVPVEATTKDGSGFVLLFVDDGVASDAGARMGERRAA